MTIDSQYTAEQYAVDTEVTYHFSFESSEDARVQVYMVTPDGNRILLREDTTEII